MHNMVSSAGRHGGGGRRGRAAARRRGGVGAAWFALGVALTRLLGIAGGAAAQGWSGAGSQGGVDWSVTVEAKGTWRESDDKTLPSPFDLFPPANLPPGQDRNVLRTVDPGRHTELTAITLQVDAEWRSGSAARLKVDAIDLDDRNPTSEDRELDVDEFWVRLGRETPTAMPADGSGAYLKVGKFAKFERQNDRHLESYGLISTAFNRFEDLGVEFGADLGRHFYLKASYTAGNPVFIRDPNALAGDNGASARTRVRPDNAPEYHSGIVILYDAEVEPEEIDPDFAETGVALGARFGNAGGTRGMELMAWGYERKLAPRAALHGTFYGGDLDLLDGPLPGTGLPIEGDTKEEQGANLWIYWGGLSLFGQTVDQEIAGMTRTGWEAEAAWRIDLPLFWAIAGRQVFPSIQPAYRFSSLDPDFVGGSPIFPAVSVRWAWEKKDMGVRLAILPELDLTVERAEHDFVLANGTHHANDETRATLRFRKRW